MKLFPKLQKFGAGNFKGGPQPKIILANKNSLTKRNRKDVKLLHQTRKK